MAAPRLARMARQLPLRTDGTLRLAVVADTHSQPHPQAADPLAARAPDAILHAGDIGDLGVLDQLARIAPVHAIRGNIDVTSAGLRLAHVDCETGAPWTPPYWSKPFRRPCPWY